MIGSSVLDLEPYIEGWVAFALRYSRFMRWIHFTEISLGHAASHSRVLVHAPKPSVSICSNIRMARRARSGCPCGIKENWPILAETNKLADAFLQEATQAPQPMHVAAAKASEATSLPMSCALASGAFPAFTEQ